MALLAWQKVYSPFLGKISFSFWWCIFFWGEAQGYFYFGFPALIPFPCRVWLVVENLYPAIDIPKNAFHFTEFLSVFLSSMMTILWMLSGDFPKRWLKWSMYPEIEGRACIAFIRNSLFHTQLLGFSYTLCIHPVPVQCFSFTIRCIPIYILIKNTNYYGRCVEIFVSDLYNIKLAKWEQPPFYMFTYNKLNYHRTYIFSYSLFYYNIRFSLVFDTLNEKILITMYNIYNPRIHTTIQSHHPSEYI